MIRIVLFAWAVPFFWPFAVFTCWVYGIGRPFEFGSYAVRRLLFGKKRAHLWLNKQWDANPLKSWEKT